MPRNYKYNRAGQFHVWNTGDLDALVHFNGHEYTFPPNDIYDLNIRPKINHVFDIPDYKSKRPTVKGKKKHINDNQFYDIYGRKFIGPTKKYGYAHYPKRKGEAMPRVVPEYDQTSDIYVGSKKGKGSRSRKIQNVFDYGDMNPYAPLRKGKKHRPSLAAYQNIPGFAVGMI